VGRPLGQTATVRCDECQYDYDTEDETTIPDRIRTLGGRYRAPLTRFLPGEDGEAVLRSHPVDGAWSALEYACHVRDVLEVLHDRLQQGLTEDVPTYTPMGREQRVIDLAYNQQPPADVVAAIGAHAERLASAFAALTPAQWGRTGIYNYPEPTERSMTWLGQHAIHEVHHHLLDVGRTLRAARGR
jgi:S-DNA-T family DNA segregation ATPase FtsK/SpoIIIE